MTSRAHLTASIALLTIVGLGSPMLAQRSDSLQVGARYRVTLPEFADRVGPQFPQSRWLTGELVERRGDTLVLRPHPSTGTVAVPFASVDRLERSRGVSRGASAFEGMFGGAFVGAIVGSIVYSFDVRGPGFNTLWQAVGTTAGYGAGAGLFTGFLFPAERWRRVRKPV